MRPWNNRDKIQATQPLSPRISSAIFGQISYDSMLQHWQKKGPVYISTYAGLNVMGTTANL